MGFVPYWDQPEQEFKDGEAVSVPMPGGGNVLIRRLEEENHDPRDKQAALNLLARDYQNEDEFLTGLVYVNPDVPTMPTQANLPDEALASLPLEKVRPTPAQLDEINESFK